MLEIMMTTIRRVDHIFPFPFSESISEFTGLTNPGVSRNAGIR
nr:MAG TPA: hypothetical protein [Caudoviricetes sp.]